MSMIDVTDPAVIALLTEALTAAGVDGLDISGPSGRLSLVVSVPGARQGGSAEASSDNRVAAAAHVVKAPLAGHFTGRSLLSAAGDVPPAVSATDVIGFIRIGSVLLPVSAGRAGRLTKLLAEAGALVGFGDPLFEVEPAAP